MTVAAELQNARLAFYRALYNRSLESLGRAQRERLDENVAGEKARYEAGKSERGEFYAATLQARELDPEIEAAHAAYGAACLQLAAAMGSALGRGAALPVPEGSLDFHGDQIYAGRMKSTAPCRPRADLKLARLMVRAARDDQRIIEADYYPMIDGIAGGDAIPVSGIHRDSGGSPQASNDTVTSEVRAGGAYTWRVIDNGQVGGAVLHQRAVRETNELQVQKLEVSIPRDLSRLQNDLRTVAARYRSLTQAVDGAERDVASVQENRAQGLASALDFRTAENSLLVTRRGILSAIYEQKVALAELDRVTGRYFQFFGDTAAKLH